VFLQQGQRQTGLRAFWIVINDSAHKILYPLNSDWGSG
jgi:hypothetical protein